MLEGKKTWIGIAITVLGMVGLGNLFTASQASELIDAGLKIVGIITTVYGNYKAHKRIEELE